MSDAQLEHRARLAYLQATVSGHSGQAVERGLKLLDVLASQSKVFDLKLEVARLSRVNPQDLRPRRWLLDYYEQWRMAGSYVRLALDLARAHRQAGRHEQAEKVLQQGVATFPDELALSIALAEHHSQQKGTGIGEEHSPLRPRGLRRKSALQRKLVHPRDILKPLRLGLKSPEESRPFLQARRTGLARERLWKSRLAGGLARS